MVDAAAVTAELINEIKTREMRAPWEGNDCAAWLEYEGERSSSHRECVCRFFMLLLLWSLLVSFVVTSFALLKCIWPIRLQVYSNKYKCKPRCITIQSLTQLAEVVWKSIWPNLNTSGRLDILETHDRHRRKWRRVSAVRIWSAQSRRAKCKRSQCLLVCEAESNIILVHFESGVQGRRSLITGEDFSRHFCPEWYRSETAHYEHTTFREPTRQKCTSPELPVNAQGQVQAELEQKRLNRVRGSLDSCSNQQTTRKAKSFQVKVGAYGWAFSAGTGQHLQTPGQRRTKVGCFKRIL